MCNFQMKGIFWGALFGLVRDSFEHDEHINLWHDQERARAAALAKDCSQLASRCSSTLDLNTSHASQSWCRRGGRAGSVLAVSPLARPRGLSREAGWFAECAAHPGIS
jgi:hypothetical protein